MLLTILLFSLMSYNVENMSWPENKCRDRVEKIARVITASDWDVPTLIGLEEVCDDSVLIHLTQDQLRKFDYGYIRHESKDKRHSNVALLYRKKDFVVQEQYPLLTEGVDRNMLYVKGLMNGTPLHVVVCHFPSQLNGKKADEARKKVEQQLKTVVEQLQAEDANARIVVMGDFNQPMTKPLAGLQPSVQPTADRASYFYKGEWQQYDQIYLSQNMADQVSKSKTIATTWMLEMNSKGLWIPKRAWRGPLYNFGYSDHLPVWVKF